ncbi:hypothetical protein [Streptomyces sp. MP131-18]|uniref:fascin domain-containing protein n=1 Tax=Streptomyces sp. MP131-18 TaxID=1857892 RepID=UPI00097CA88E|nr:hypothetical protein [Streptomyces sp. MP131-18]ONK10697.1 hypothetical protein STBA_14200 [Streptomyces sp. MP131-18]
MRRKAAVLLSLCGLLAVSTLGATAASGAPQTDDDAPAPAGWERVDTQLLNELLADDGAAPLNASADEPEELPWAVQSVNTGLFVASEQRYAEPYTGVLRARSDSVGGGWEQFDIYFDDASETVTLTSRANGLNVATERNFTGASNGVLRARSEGVGSWERFVLYYHDDLQTFAFRSVVNDLFVATEQNNTGSLQNVLRARSDWINGSWEQFYLF